MTRYVSMLRGINVGGKKPIKMDALKAMYKSLGFENIQTYVQSGNVLFAANETDSKVLEALISKKIQMEFGFEVPVIVFDVPTFEQIIQENPLCNKELIDPLFLHVTFLDEVPAPGLEEMVSAKKFPNEMISFSKRAVYLYCPDGYAKTKLNNALLEKQLKVKATTRNWKTTNALLDLAKS